MKLPSVFLLIASLILIAGLVTAGCTQSTGSVSPATNTASQSTGNPSMGPGDGTNSPGQQGSWQNASQNGNTPGSNLSRQSHGGGVMNDTRMTAAAAQLGVTETALKDALSSTVNGRPDMDAAAQKLHVTRQQLTDALGFSANATFNGTRTRGGFNGTANWTPGAGPGP